MRTTNLIVILSLLILITGCTPEISKDDLKIVDIKWIALGNMTLAEIEVEALKAPLNVQIKPIFPESEIKSIDYNRRKGCGHIITKKGISTINSCLGDPMRKMIIYPNTELKICFSYGKEFSRDNQICLNNIIAK